MTYPPECPNSARRSTEHMMQTPPDPYLVDRVAFAHSVDRRTLMKEFETPGSVSGKAGYRVRLAVAELRRTSTPVTAAR